MSEINSLFYPTDDTKTDIEFRAKTSAGDTDVSASFEGVIYDDPEYT